MKKSPKSLSGCRVLITDGSHAGQEGVCLGPAADGKRWSVSPGDSNEILSLEYDKQFGLLLDMTGDNKIN